MVALSLRTPIAFFKIILQEDSREAVVRDALEYYKQASPAIRQQLENAMLAAHVHVKGFREPLRAPVPALLPAVMTTASRSNRLLKAILHVWLERHADLRGAVREFLRTRDMLATEVVDPSEGATASLEPLEIFEVTTAFQAQYVDFDRNNVALMVCCFAVRAPLPAEEAFSKKEGATVRWEQWLTELRGLSADAPEWETVTEFVESVQQLGKDKRREREASREPLRRALASLQEQATADLAYFELEVASWTAEACPFAEATALAAQVTQLHEALSTHGHLRQQRGVTLTEDRHLRTERDRLAEFVLQTHARLSTALTISPPENPAAQTPSPKTPLPHVEEATLKEEGTSKKEEQKDRIPCTSSCSTNAEPVRVKQVVCQHQHRPRTCHPLRFHYLTWRKGPP